MEAVNPVIRGLMNGFSLGNMLQQRQMDERRLAAQEKQQTFDNDQRQFQNQQQQASMMERLAAMGARPVTESDQFEMDGGTAVNFNDRLPIEGGPTITSSSTLLPARVLAMPGSGQRFVLPSADERDARVAKVNQRTLYDKFRAISEAKKEERLEEEAAYKRQVQERGGTLPAEILSRYGIAPGTKIPMQTIKEILNAVASEDANRRASLEFAVTLPGKAAQSESAVIETGQRKKLGMTAVQAAQIANAKESRDLTRRGQNMTDARSRELAEISRDNKPPSAAEQRAGGFWHRAAEAEKNLKVLEPEMAKKGVLDQAFYNRAPNWLQSDENQAYRQSQRAFIEAVLRKDSGAAIPPSEYQSLSETYFPQPGDTPKLIAQKQKSRMAALESLRNESGRALKAYGETQQPLKPQDAGGPDLSKMTTEELMRELEK
jgi:hypothetical protein